MQIGRELPTPGQPLQGLPFPNGVVALDVTENAGRADEKPAVHPGAIAVRFLLEGLHPVPGDPQRPESPRGLRGRECGQTTLLSVAPSLGKTFIFSKRFMQDWYFLFISNILA